VFWVALIVVGFVKGYLSVDHPENSFYHVMAATRPYLEAFTAAGLGVMIALGAICVIYLRHSAENKQVTLK